MVNKEVWQKLHNEFAAKGVILVAVSKTKPVSDIQELYTSGQRDFGENYVQELTEKQAQLPQDIHWHYIGHLQSNKVKDIASFVYLIHAVDSFKLLLEINKQALKIGRIIDVLLQMYIADEETKFGLDEKEIIVLLDYYEARKKDLQNVRICGLMGMATNTEDEKQVHTEFFRLHNFFTLLADTSFFGKPWFSICSMGMSADYEIAIQEGSNMVRIGSMLFGRR
ncbi:MAG: YggS family pyridoxal phosphate-dependent enzyme [Chitinophagales bacterium]